MGLLDSLVSMLGSMNQDKLTVHEERCVILRNRNARCLRCVQACTSKALMLKDGQLEVFPERCIGCGTCATACPTSAIEVKALGDRELLGRLKASVMATDGHPVAACERAVAAAEKEASSTAVLEGWRGALGLKADDAAELNREAICVVPCLGRVDESFLVAMAAYGCSDGYLVCDGCEGCEHEPGGSQALDVLESAEGLLEAYGAPLKVEFTSQMPSVAFGKSSGGSNAAPQCEEKALRRLKKNVPLDPQKRAFFADVASASKNMAADVVAEGLGLGQSTAAQEPPSPRYRKVGPDGTLSRFVPTRRTVLFNLLSRLGKPEAAEVRNRVIGKVTIDPQACNACRMCAVFCPTGALERYESGGVWGLMHRPSMCVQCRSCESLCPQQAISVSDTVPMRQFMGKESVIFSMEQPQWQPNKPDSIFTKMHGVIGEHLEMSAF